MALRRIALFALIAASVATGGVWLFRPAPIRVEVAPVVSDRFRVVVEEEGRTRVRDRYLVSAPIGGLVARAPWRVGDRVQAGAALASIRPNLPPLLDPRSRQELEERLGAAEAQVEEAQALEARAKVALERAETDLARTRALRARGVATEAALERDTYAFEQARRELQAAERRVHAATHARAQAQAALRRSEEGPSTEAFTVSSPVSGVVLRLLQESEAVVPAGASLLEIGDCCDIEIVASLLTTDAVQVRPGARVEIDRWGGRAQLEGRVRRVEPAGFTKVSPLGVEEQRVWTVIDIVSPPEQRAGLGDGFRADVRIVVDELEAATVVPVGALFRRGEAWHAFIVEDERARLRPVEVLRRSGRLAALGPGIAPGMEVVLFPPGALVDGSRISRILPVAR